MLKKILIISALLFSSAVFAKGPIPEGKYTIDPMHSKLGFSIGHLVISTVEGRFNQFEGKMDVNKKVEKSKVNVTAEVTSIDTGVSKRDDHLKSPDFFDAAKFPKMTFVSKKITQNNENLKVLGTLKIKNVSKDVTFDMKYNGDVKDASGQEKIAFTGEAEISRKDFGITYGNMIEAGPAIGDAVKISLIIQAIKDVKPAKK